MTINKSQEIKELLQKQDEIIQYLLGLEEDLAVKLDYLIEIKEVIKREVYGFMEEIERLEKKDEREDKLLKYFEHLN